MTKYVEATQAYFNHGLLRPDNAVLDETHKSFLLDSVLGQDDQSAGASDYFLTKLLMDASYRSISEWQRLDTWIRSFIDLLILWIPLHRGHFLYAFYNDMLYRRYKYYTLADKKVVQHVRSTFCADLDCSTVNDSVPGELLLVYHIDVFRKAGGFDVVMKTISDPNPIGVRYFRTMIRFLWMIKPFYDDQIRTEILPRLPEAAFRSQLLNFDTKNMREISSKDMEMIFQHMRLILAGSCDVETVLLEHGFEFALKCLDADILAKRILGIEWVTQQLISSYAALPEMKQKLKQKILGCDFFGKVYHHSVMKKQIVDNSRSIVLWILAEHALTAHHLDQIFRGLVDNLVLDSDVCDGFFELLTTMAGAKMKPRGSSSTSDDESDTEVGGEGDTSSNYCVPLIWKRLQGLASPNAWSTARAVQLVAAIARQEQPTESSRQALAWLWEAVDKTGSAASLSPASRVEAVAQLSHLPGAVADKESQIEELFLRDGRLVHLKLLVGELAALPKKDQEPAARKLFDRMFDASLRAVRAYRREAVKLGLEKIVDVYPHMEEIRLRCDSLTTLVLLGNISITAERMEAVWDAMMNLGPDGVDDYVMHVEERDVSLECLLKLASDAHKASVEAFADDGGKSDFPLSRLLALLGKHPEFAANSRKGFANFREIFEGANGSNGAMDFVTNDRGLRPVLKKLNVWGWDAVWGIALLADASISKDVDRYLNDLYFLPSPDMSADTVLELREQFCAKAMILMASLVGRRIEGSPLSLHEHQRLLEIIKQGIEATSQLEDLAKKRDAAASGLPTDVPLKDLPKPRYTDQTGYVQMALDSGMMPEFVPQELRHSVMTLLFDRFNWMRFDYWAGDMYEKPDLMFSMIEKAREYKIVLPKDDEKDALQHENLASCSQIIASQPAYWETFFALLEQLVACSATVSQQGWEVMSLLDTDTVLYKKISLTDETAAGASFEWEQLLGNGPNYKLLHSLQMLERSFIPGRDDSSEEHARKTIWCKKFLRVGGFRYLMGLLHSMATQADIHKTPLSTQALVRVLDVVYRFMRAPLPATEFSPDLEGRSPLELSTSSENLMFAGPTVHDIPEVMFSLVHAHASSEQSLMVASSGESGQQQQQQYHQVGNYALYLLTACILKVPAVWRSFRDSLDKKKLLDTLTSKNTGFSVLVSERLLHLSRNFSLPLDTSVQGPGPRDFIMELLLKEYPSLKQSHCHDCRSVFAAISSLLSSADDAVNMEPIIEELMVVVPADESLEPDEYVAGLMLLAATLIKRDCEHNRQLGGGGGSLEKGEALYSRLLSEFLYAPLTDEGLSSALAKSNHLRQASFNLVGALVSSGSLGVNGLDRGLDALGTQYMENAVANEWKQPAVLDSEGEGDGVSGRRIAKASRYMGLRNLACTCYMNSTVQQLVNVEPFVKALLLAPTPQEDVKGKEAAKQERKDQIDGLSNLTQVVRQVVSDPKDELVRLLSPESSEYKTLAGTEYFGQPALDFLKSLGWEEDSSGSLILPLTVDPGDNWQESLRSLNDSVVGLKAEDEKLKREANPITMFADLQRMVAHLSKGTTGGRFFDPKDFLANFPDIDGRPVDVRVQEDAFEIFQRLQFLIEEQLKGTPQAKIFDSLFGVREVHVLHCNVHAKASRPQIAPIIPVGFAPTLAQAMDQVYNKEGEWLAEFKCEQCVEKVRGRKTAALESTSDFLIFYVKRYDGAQQKIKATFNISQELDVSRWSNAAIHEEVKDSLGPDAWQYELVGTLNHDGVSMNAGHYFSVINREDGMWWRFNDTNVTPFKSALTEENIGGECVMLFYRRKKLLGDYSGMVDSAVTMNKKLEQDVLEENQRTYRLKLLNERSLFETMQQLLISRTAHLDGVSEERHLWLAQLAFRFVFETLARFRHIASSSNVLSAWSGQVLQPLFKSSRQACRWLLETLLSDRSPWLEEFLLHKDEAPMRKVFADLVWEALQSVLSEDLESGSLNVPKAGRIAAAFSRKPAAASETTLALPLSIQFMDRIVAMSEMSRTHWSRHHEFWNLVARWAEHGPVPRRHLAVTLFPVYVNAENEAKTVSLDFPSLVLDYFLGQFSICKKSNHTRSAIGDRASLSLTRQWDAMALVVRAMSNKAMQRSPMSLDVDENGFSILDGDAPPTLAIDALDLLMAVKVPQALTEIIKLGYNVEANVDVMRHLCWESVDASRVWLKRGMMAFDSVSGSASAESRQRPLSLLVAAVAMDDSQRDYRMARVFDGTSETTSIFGVMKRLASSGYSNANAEKVIVSLAPFAKALEKPRKTMSNNSLELVRVYVQRQSEKEDKEQEQEQNAILTDAFLILDRFTNN